MKISIEQANKLLAAWVADVVVVENETDADNEASIDDLAISVNDAISKSLKPLLEEQLKASMEPAFTGRYLGALRSAAQRVFNVPKRELEEMTIEQVLARCKGSLESRYSQTDEQKQTQLETTINEYEGQIEKLKLQHEQILQDERLKYMQKDIASRCISLMEKMPRKGGDLQEQADMLKYKMQATYEVRYNEDTHKLEFYKEGKPAMKDDTHPVTDEDFARNWAEKAGILVHDTRHISPAEVKAGQQGGYAGMYITDQDTETDNGINAIAAWADR